jgi:ribosomal protein L37E
MIKEYIMHCPNCGHSATPSQNYCRSCGFNLEKFLDLYNQQSYRTEISLSNVHSSLEKVMAYLSIAGGTAFAGGSAFFIIFLLYAIVAKIIIEKGQIYLGATLLLFLIGATLLLISIYYKESQKDKSLQKTENWTRELTSPAEPNNLFSKKYLEQAPSVTEKTTELFKARNENVK